MRSNVWKRLLAAVSAAAMTAFPLINTAPLLQAGAVESPEELSARSKANADIDLDGSLNEVDVLNLCKHLCGLYKTLPIEGVTAAPDPDCLYGDANLDGAVTLDDVVAVNRNLMYGNYLYEQYGESAYSLTLTAADAVYDPSTDESVMIFINAKTDADELHAISTKLLIDGKEADGENFKITKICLGAFTNPSTFQRNSNNGAVISYQSSPWSSDKVNNNQAYAEITVVPQPGVAPGEYSLTLEYAEAVEDSGKKITKIQSVEGTLTILGVEPTEEPTTEAPTEEPTEEPTIEAPTEEPTEEPTTEAPTEEPTEEPTTEAPTEEPTEEPTTEAPTEEPTEEPITEAPTEEPTEEATAAEIIYEDDNESFTANIDVGQSVNEQGKLAINTNGLCAVFDADAVQEMQNSSDSQNVALVYQIVAEGSNPAQDAAVSEAIQSGGKAFELMLTDENGDAVQFSANNNGSVTITLPYTAPVSANHVVVYYIAPDGTRTDMHAVYDSSAKTVTFTTTHFSLYTIEAVEEELPQTGSNSWNSWILTAGAAALIGAGIWMVLSAKRRRTPEA